MEHRLPGEAVPMAKLYVPPAPDDLAFGALDAEGWPILRPTQLTIHRTSPEDVQDRQIILSLNGKKIATLLYGQTFSLEIPPGRYKLRANNTLVWKTVEFEAPPGAEVHFTCVNRAPGSFLYMLLSFGPAPLFVTLVPGRPESG